MESKDQFIAQLSSLYGIINMLGASFDLDKILEQILDSAVDMFRADAGSIMLLENDVLTISKAKKLSEEIIANTRIKIGHGIVGKVAESGEAILINGLIDSSRFSDVVKRDEQISSSMCAPMIHNGKTVGVLNVRCGGTTKFTESDLEFFKALATQAAISIEIANLYQAECERAELLREEKRHMQEIFTHMADGVIVFSDNYDIIFSNALAMNAYNDGNNMVGEDVRMFFPSVHWKKLKEQLSEGQSYEFEVQPVTSSHHSIWRGNITSWKNGQEQMFVLVLHDVTERIRVELMKTEFISSVSHELKTPLTSIIGFQELMIDRELDRNRQLRCLGICHDESKRLLRLIEDILMVSKLESGSYRIRTSKNVLDDLLSQAVSNYAERYPKYTFSLNLPIKQTVLDYDEMLINQVLENLLSNAVKYTMQDGHISVCLETKDNQAIVSVSDNGIGIPSDKMPFIFEKFFRVDNSLTCQTGGIGLGLANARHIVEEHGGVIWAESKEGEGSTFYFSLPYIRNY